MFRRSSVPEGTMMLLPDRFQTLRVSVHTALVGLLLGIAGCGGTERQIESEKFYEPPLEHRIVVETVVDRPFDLAWARLIQRLSESPSRVSALEKESRFIRIDLNRSGDLASSANKPARYVDCGRTTRTLRGAGPSSDSVETFEYAVADPSQHRESIVQDDGFRVSEVNRRIDLEASATIYLEPDGRQRTRVTVQSRYTIQIEIEGSAQFFPLDAEAEPSAPERFGPRRESIRFTTFQPGFDQRRGGLTCRATGDFEHELVGLANPAAAI